MQGNFETTLRTWKSVGYVVLGLCLLLDIGVPVKTDVFEAVVLAIFLALICGLGLFALQKERWATASICLGIAGIFHAVALVGIVGMIASVRMWSAAEKLWSRQ